MDASSIILGLFLFFQMGMVLVMLNPIYDVRRITRCINNTVATYRMHVIVAFGIYFATVLYLGMYIPLNNILRLIFCDKNNEYQKLLLLRKIEKNYVVAGFSLFLIVVIYGVKSLVSYTACLIELMDRQNDFPTMSHSKFAKSLYPLANSKPSPIIPGLLSVKRSISYETIMFSKELKDHMRNLMRNDDFPNRSALSDILESNRATAVHS